MILRLALILIICSGGLFSSAFGQVRVQEPIILTGAEIMPIAGFPTESVVAFRYWEGTWEQVPVQIDQLDYRSAYDLYNQDASNVNSLNTLVYCDPKTYAGEDTDPLIDENDELVFMSQDLGAAYSGDEYPEYTLYDPVEVIISDPINDSEAFLYLFLQTGALPQDAGRPYVQYDYQLLAGDHFKNAYNITGANPEDSYVTTQYYEQHFSDDWIRDQIVITAGDASGLDILDYDKIQLAPGLCYRHIGTFSAGAGTHITSISGPVRAIRSIMGANSGALIQRTQFFYENKDQTETVWRVHPVRGITEYYDYTEDASGMTYYNEHNPNGVKIDGEVDLIDPTFAHWSLLTGAPGSILSFTDLHADFPLTGLQNYYLDQRNAEVEQCIGDPHAMGANGFFLQQDIPNTDPRDGAYNSLSISSTSYYLPPHQSTQAVDQYYQVAEQPLVATTEGDFTIDKDQAELQVFPNPATDYLNIQIFPTGTTEMALFDLQGKRILEKTIYFAHHLELPPHLESGIYVIRAVSGKEVLSQRVYIQR